MGLADLLEKLLPHHPWRAYTVDGATKWKFWPCFILSLVLVAMTIILDALMPGADYSSIEFCFTIENFMSAMEPLLLNTMVGSSFSSPFLVLIVILTVFS